MKHIGALLLKFVVVAIVLEIVLMNLTDLTFWSIIAISLVITILAYLLGDLAILPRSNNIVATIADIGLSLVVILLYNYVYPDADISFTDALVAALALGVGEWVYHKFVAKSVLPAHDDRDNF